ncbi:MAG: UbiD family decarboxylase, partial [Chloroflexi bacterium]|nr:UbiD family decarboxylase [Chloroflexota bacterium]
VGLHLSPGKDARLHISQMWEAGQEIPVSVVLGVDPLQFLVSSLGFPKNVSEYDHVGGIRGEAVPVTTGLFSDLPFPAAADIVLECVAQPHQTRKEGPFGEITGYYGRPESEAPLLKVKAIHQRRNPILTNALMAEYPSCECGMMWAIMRSARVWADLEKMGIPGIKGVYAHPAAAGGLGAIIISVQQMYAGHAPQALAIAAQSSGGAFFTKWIIAVEEDVDPTDMNDVLWAMSTRCNPTEDIDILRQTWSTWLDPTQNPADERPWSSKALINACREHRYLHVFSTRTAIRREMYDRVASRWSELGLEGAAPQVRAFFNESDKRRALIEAEELHSAGGNGSGPDAGASATVGM